MASNASLPCIEPVTLSSCFRVVQKDFQGQRPAIVSNRTIEFLGRRVNTRLMGHLQPPSPNKAVGVAWIGEEYFWTQTITLPSHSSKVIIHTGFMTFIFLNICRSAEPYSSYATRPGLGPLNRTLTNIRQQQMQCADRKVNRSQIHCLEKVSMYKYVKIVQSSPPETELVYK